MLTKEQLTSYHDNGFLCPIQIIDTNDAGQLREKYDDTFNSTQATKLLENAGVSSDEFSLLDDDPHLLFKWVADLVFHSTVVGAVRDILGPDILIWETRFFPKKAHTANFISWHQDLKYWKLNDDCKEVTAWIALSPSTEKSGCMRVVPGSHKRELVDHKETFASENMLSRGQEIAVDVDEKDAVNMVLKPGEMSLHDGKIFHASHPNRSDDDRIGLAIRCLPASANQTYGRGLATLLCGSSTQENFKLMQPARNNNPTPDQVRHLSELYKRFDG
ncbi:MAG: phytanoyl-CoA dioxygenase family protein [Pseudomonadota bacterium]